jgi:hypothetical protein
VNAVLAGGDVADERRFVPMARIQSDGSASE